MSSSTVAELWAWLESHHDGHPGVWVELQKTSGADPSVRFDDLLEAGIAYGWSESSRRAGTSTTYLQRFTPRRARGTMSVRNLRIAGRLEQEGRMTPAGRRALGRWPSAGRLRRPAEPRRATAGPAFLTRPGGADRGC